MKIEKKDMVMVYDGGGTVPHCKYTGRFGDLTAYWQEIVSDAVYLFRLGETMRISVTGIRMSLANTRTPRKRSRRRKHSYRRMGTRSMTRNMASAPLPIGL